ncbi:unnamed protein product [Brassicogethes aeneus]|uniref:G-protein coupled receptors family 3 profile domain-containing protein n=1 Tax=Brassicogethes aeneus TaxID=1431903 RepID=A0A9P0B1Q9_BRAAE|nr:unnamed protein product [Brassicogethes aeneus]
MLPHIIIPLLTVLSQTVSQEIYSDPSDVNMALILNKCNSATPYSTHSVVNSAIWTTQRINFLEITSPLKFGLTVIQTCSQKENMNTIFNLYNSSDEHYLVGVISEERFDDKTSRFSDILDIQRKVIPKIYKAIIKSTVEFMSMMNWFENVTVTVTSERFLSEFYTYATRKFICINSYLIWRNTPSFNNISSDTVIFFGNKDDIDLMLTKYEDRIFYNNLLIIPLDSSVPKDLPQDTYVMIPNHGPISKYYKKSANIVLTPQLFDIATPMLNFAHTIGKYIKTNCNETVYKINCLRSTYHDIFPRRIISPREVMEILKIQPLTEHFVYNIYLADDVNNSVTLKKNNYIHPYTKVFTYNVLTDKWLVHNVSVILENIESHNETEEFCKENVDYCIKNCKNYHQNILDNREIFGESIFDNIYIRTDSWVYTFLSLSALGILFCIAILFFIFISICRRDILEGNPSLTIFLLVTVMLMFLSILPFCINVTSIHARDTLCHLKAMAVTVTYALAFSLILSRSILLASASKELGFMSHISGSVQSFLSLFIFGVQAALCLQIMGRCDEIFRGYSFIFLISYNVMLLLLLLCLCPLIYKCQRNFREGKYFVIAICLTTVFWCLWIPAYACFKHQWKEPILCFGLVSTASILLGSIFVPRTYQMTIAVARDRITSRLPSLATATSTMDIYRANTQPVYDCVNVAAINAANVARAGMVGTGIQQPDLYSCPALPADDDIDFRCDSPLSSDKVTRF